MAATLGLALLRAILFGLGGALVGAVLREPVLVGSLALMAGPFTLLEHWLVRRCGVTWPEGSVAI